MPATALAAPSISPETAGEKRDAIRDAAASHAESEDWDAQADALEADAKLLGDPITMLESAEARLKYAEQAQSVEACEEAIVTTMVALDILQFYDAVSTGGATSRWRVIDPDLASDLISDAEAKIDKAEALIEEIESDDLLEDEGGAVASADKPKKEKKKRKKREGKPGTVFIISGSVLAGVGLAGVGVGFAGLASSAAKQKEVEDKIVPEEQAAVDKLDEEGRRANLMGLVGLAVGGGALVGGAALLVVGVLKRKKAGPSSASARLNVSPVFGRHTNGVAVHGRF